MNVVGKLVYYAATPFHPFGGAVDIIVVQQQDGSFRSTPWYVRFGKFQGVLKGAEKIVRIEVNGVEANFHMYLDNSGEAYFIREVVSGKDGEANGDLDDSDTLEGTPEDSSIDYNNNDDSRENDVNFFRHSGSVSNSVELYLQDGHESERRLYEFQDEQSSLEGSAALSEYGSSRSENLDSVDHLMESENLNSEVVLVSVDGHILKAPISSSDNTENVQLSIPQFHLGPGEAAWPADCFSDLNASTPKVTSEKVCNMNNDNNVLENLDVCDEDGEKVGCQDRELRVHSNLEDGSASLNKEDTFKSCLDLSDLPMQVVSAYQLDTGPSLGIHDDPQDNSPQSHMTIDGAEDGGVGESRNTGGLSSSKSYPSREISSDLQVEVVPIDKKILDTGHNGSDDMPDHSGSNEKKLVEQIDVALADEGIGSNPRTASKDECSKSNMVEPQIDFSNEDMKTGLSKRVEISLCENLLNAGMGLSAAAKAFDTHRISEEEFKLSAASIAKNENLVVRFRGKYLPWDKAAPIVLGLAAYGLDIPVDLNDAIPVEETPKSREEDSGVTSTPSGRRWSLWPIPFRRVKTIDDTNSNLSSEDVFVDSLSQSENQPVEPTPVTHGSIESPHKQLLRTNIPTTEQIASLNLREGKNVVTFIFSTRVLGVQKVEAHIYLWKWNARIVISDVDGTITKSDVLGQFMPLVGRDWTQSGVARLFSAIEENGYQLLFLSARAIVQAYLTRSYLLNLKQDGKALPSGPVVISPDGLFPSLYREVIRRAPHEFKIACLEDIKALFPSDYNPFYAGFGNRDTDEFSYLKIGIPKGKIFIINPKGEVAISHRIGVRSYTSLHTLVNDMFPPTSMIEQSGCSIIMQEDYNSWNYWKMPVADIDIV